MVPITVVSGCTKANSFGGEKKKTEDGIWAS